MILCAINLFVEQRMCSKITKCQSLVTYEMGDYKQNIFIVPLYFLIIFCLFSFVYNHLFSPIFFINIPT